MLELSDENKFYLSCISAALHFSIEKILCQFISQFGKEKLLAILGNHFQLRYASFIFS